MGNNNDKYATALNCIDGKVQIPVINWIKTKKKYEYVDMITEPGVDAFISSSTEEKLMELREKISISVKKHESDFIAIVGHHDCKKNIVSDNEHKKQVRTSVERVRKWFPECTVIGLFIEKDMTIKEYEIRIVGF